ncbi:hypothetical protein BDW59DRAFT_139799 [Aspergillus cavernicola]|uniref:Secreted protein n=1 Tax=Aspergillus cavernicola TaxID=176166 RepID=A0ABR4IWN5_9EURO
MWFQVSCAVVSRFATLLRMWRCDYCCPQSPFGVELSTGCSAGSDSLKHAHCSEGLWYQSELRTEAGSFGFVIL